MAKAKITIDEMVYNTILNGKQIYYNNELKTIDYVKFVKDTRLIQVVCIANPGEEPDVFMVNQDKILEFEVDTIKPIKPPTKPKLK